MNNDQKIHDSGEAGSISSAAPIDAASFPPSTALARTYFFSASQNAFFLSDELPLFQAAGTLPSELTPVGQMVFQEFALELPPAGKTRSVNQSGMPCWADEPPLPDTVVAALNEGEREALLRSAAEQIAPLQDAVDLEQATAEEAERLRAWKAYRVALLRLEGKEGYPLLVEWPEQPG